MPRRLGNVKNELKFHDNVSNSDLVIYYRMPTTPERVAYSNMAVQRKKGKLVFKRIEANAEFGARVFEGFPDGMFEDEKGLPMSCDKASPAYCPTWKEQIIGSATDVIALLGEFVFNGSVSFSAPPDPDAVTVEDIMEEIDSAIEEGLTLEALREKLEKILEEADPEKN